MRLISQNTQNHLENINNNEQDQKTGDQPILCPHCQRTASNGIKCKGICVADNDY